MDYGRIIRISLDSFWAHKLRTFLSKELDHLLLTQFFSIVFGCHTGSVGSIERESDR